jgi:hypothetical protein
MFCGSKIFPLSILYFCAFDIDKLIADMHPRHRRLRQAEKALKESIDKGKILDPQNIPHKIEQYFEKNWKPEEPEIKPKPKIVDVQESITKFSGSPFHF